MSDAPRMRLIDASTGEVLDSVPLPEERHTIVRGVAHCSFCGRPRARCKRLIASRASGKCICDRCVRLGASMMHARIA